MSGNIALGAPQKASGEADNRSLQCPGLVSDFLSIEVYWGKLKVSKADMRGQASSDLCREETASEGDSEHRGGW